ncbi:MAG: hypothetical protein ACRERC_06730 [Candidatus Binatia bacterium]
MTWAERLMRLASSDPLPDLAERLLPMQRGFGERARRLEAHALLAPTAGAEQSLARQAARQAELAESIAAALRQRGVPVPDVRRSDAAGTESSHWARLITDLEAARAANATVLSQTPAVIEDAPDLAPLLRALREGLEELLSELRTLIARADPHALN